MLKRLSVLLSAVPAFRDQAHEIEKLEQVNQAYQALLPRGYRGISHVSQLAGGEAVIVVGSSAAAGKLRQRVPGILEQLQKQAPQVSAIRLKLQVENSYTPMRQRTIPVLTNHAAEVLRRTAAEAQGSPLADALQRLAARVRQEKSDED